MDRSSISTFSVQTQDSDHNWKREPSEFAEIYPAELSGDEGKPNYGQDESQKSSFAGAVLNTLNTAIGAGVLGLPYIIRQLGVLLGATVLTVGALILYICSDLLQRTKNLSRHSNYVTIAQHCFKDTGYKLLAATLIINNLGSCVIYLAIFATVAQNLAGSFEPTCLPGALTPWFCKQWALIVFGGLIVLPFNFLKSFDKLAIASFFKITSIALFTSIEFGYFIYSRINGTAATDIEIWPSFKDPVGMIACVTQVFFAFCFLPNQFAIYKSMKGATDASMDRVISTSIGIIGAVYTVIAMSGYAIFGTATDNVLKNFSKDDLGTFFFLLLNISFLVTSLMTYPPTYFSPRNIIYQAILNRVQSEYELVAKAKKEIKDESSQAGFVYTMVVLVTNGLIVVLAIVAPGINELFGLIGSLATGALIFIFPATFYLVLASNKGKKRGTAISMLVLGTVLGVSGFITNLYKMFNTKPN